MRLITASSYVMLVFSTIIGYCNETHVRQCPFCRDELVWEKRLQFPGLHQAANDEPLSQQPCLHTNDTFIKKNCDFACLEVEFHPHHAKNLYYYRDCSEGLLQKELCANCYPNLTQDLTNVTINKSVFTFDEFGDKWTFRFCAGSDCFHHKHVDDVARPRIEGDIRSAVGRVLLVIFAALVMLVIIRVLCISKKISQRMRMDDLSIDGRMIGNQPNKVFLYSPTPSEKTNSGSNGLASEESNASLTLAPTEQSVHFRRFSSGPECVSAVIEHSMRSDSPSAITSGQLADESAQNSPVLVGQNAQNETSESDSAVASSESVTANPPSFISVQSLSEGSAARRNNPTSLFHKVKENNVKSPESEHSNVAGCLDPLLLDEELTEGSPVKSETDTLENDNEETVTESTAPLSTDDDNPTEFHDSVSNVEEAEGSATSDDGDTFEPTQSSSSLSYSEIAANPGHHLLHRKRSEDGK
ncbi:hypothetical protein RB195_026084 [Necator americanus]|uniref:Uncharacterized protein n=1 Tax=Necator americanus TaxID=51031 RepID=A0ABR1EVA4_NECAM